MVTTEPGPPRARHGHLLHLRTKPRGHRSAGTAWLRPRLVLVTWRGVPLTPGPPFSKAILPPTERKSRGTVPACLVLGAKEQGDGGVRSAGDLLGRRLRGGHGADCTLAACVSCTSLAEDGPGRDPVLAGRVLWPGGSHCRCLGLESMPLGAPPRKSLLSELVGAPQSIGEPRSSLKHKEHGSHSYHYTVAPA